MSTRVALDLTQHHFVHTRGDLTIYGAWHGDRVRPCLAVLPAHREGIPLVVEIDDAWQWNPDDHVADPKKNARLIGAFLYANGFNDANSITAMRVVTLIHDHLGDLLSIPPKPAELVVVADAFRTDADGKVHHSEVRERV